jgi:hypothetical protein
MMADNDEWVDGVGLAFGISGLFQGAMGKFCPIWARIDVYGQLRF